ncbi:hypothetical protein VE01_03852 [Pseudogymnoascus verrucosus]|uniref:DUF7730 domain-containing protein n=1 Tax=Pseudogymnoascus verrucosus TaxID=342668 RepID=A0A1B8GQU4_9PEZI|nr:uncharacterized protein VE01_03852 [Pseudogymnoascus verrucosus]OBT98208.2 hypothetical protein VE01_03852 [Pseudogymnoascus verrucosus]
MMVDFKKLFNRKNHKTIRPKRPEYEDKNVQPCLPKTRNRSLSVYESGQNTSGLLWKLPVELRRRIYDEVLGHRKVHLLFEFAPRKYRRDRTNKKEILEWRWWHCICTWDQTMDSYSSGIWFDRCKDVAVNGNPGSSTGMMGRLKLDFAILLTCRQIYSEAIDILYSTTIFDFGTRQLLCDFPSLVLPQRFALISAIEMIWEFIDLGLSPIDTKRTQLYRDMWAMLAAMPNLRHLKIAVASHECPDPAPPDLKEVWLGPPKQLGKLDVFVVLVPDSYARSFDFSVDEGSNFTLDSFPDIVTMHCM